MTRINTPAYIKIGEVWTKVGHAVVSPETMHLYKVVLDEDAPVREALKALMESKLNADIRLGAELDEPPEPQEDEYEKPKSQITFTPAPRVSPSVQERMGYTRPSRQAWPN